MKLRILTAILILFSLNSFCRTGFLHADGKKIVNGAGEEVLLRGMGLGGWMLQEGYMLETADFAGTQHEIKATIENLIGKEGMEAFYDEWLKNYCTKEDVDSMAAWGFNSIRLPMHYNLFTLPIEDEPVKGADTWLEKGFLMIDELLEWCEANKIYLILDLHATPGGQGKDANISDYDTSKPSLWESEENQRKTVALWKKIAERYVNEEWIGGYDLINETNWDMSGNIPLKSLMKNLTATIREVDNNHLIFIEGNGFANDYTGLTPPWDKNMAYSFHRYWNYNTVNTIQWVLDLRNTHNVPLWMGESGENSNVWFTNSIRLLEQNNIGWAWWPYKKIGSVTGTVTIPKTAGYQKLLDYWKGSGAKPSVSDATAWLMEMAENMKLKNCIIHRDVLDAMFRQIHDKKAVPFKEHTIPGIIYATDYDLGSLRYAYFDSDTANYRSETGTFTAWNSGYSYRNDGVDIEACTDTEGTNGFNVGWTAKGEWLGYTVDIKSDASFSIDIRYAAASSTGKLHFELNGIHISKEISLPATGGWANWKTITIENIVFKKGIHQLKVYVENEGFNLNFLKFHSEMGIGGVYPEFLNLETDDSGNNIKVLSNIGFLASSVPSADEFKLVVNNKEVAIKNVFNIESSLSEIIIQPEEELFSTDKILLSYSGSSLKSPTGAYYDPFSDWGVDNNITNYVSLPAKIQAENFVFNYGMQTETCTDTGGGLNVGYANPGDYLDYNIYVTESGDYNFEYRYASQVAGKFDLMLLQSETEKLLHSVSISSTGGWQVWKNISKTSTLPKGKITVRIKVISGEFNINWFNVSSLNKVDLTELSDNDIFAYFSDNSGSLNINYSGNEKRVYEISCYDLQGRCFFNNSVGFNNSGETRLFIPNIEKGIYLIHFKGDEKSRVQKLFVF
ncbi:MAG: carbohydrate-binding protein [Prolixibacteraceae bacterium]|nr:carbohydrate-binding protein [Prolixibacteraceae bacterium]